MLQGLMTWLNGTDLFEYGKNQAPDTKASSGLAPNVRASTLPASSLLFKNKNCNNIVFPNLFLTKCLAFFSEAPLSLSFPKQT